MIVCVCHRISDREINRHVQAGLDFSDIQLELGVATQCGQCEPCARALVARCAGRPDCAEAACAGPAPSYTQAQPQPLPLQRLI